MRRHVRLVAPRKDGSRLLDHLSATVPEGGEWPEEYPLPEVPEAGTDLWDWFWDIRAGVPSGFNGPDVIAHTELEAWARLTRTTLQPVHIRLLRALDQQFISSHSEIRAKKG